MAKSFLEPGRTLTASVEIAKEKGQMEFMTEILGEVVVMTILAIAFSFVVWKLTKRKTDFGDFLTRYGDMLAYAGLLLIVLIIILVQGLN